jgi:xanthine dehydrogenase YagR molybdenum-binding subunit
MPQATRHVGRGHSRVEGRLKVTGQARYAAEYTADRLLHGWLVPSRIARGRVVRIDTREARAIDGVVEIYSHENRPIETARRDRSWRDDVAPPGEPFRPFQSAEIQFADQPVALVIAETLEAARDAAALVTVVYEAAEPVTDFRIARGDAYRPPRKRFGIPRPPRPRGNPGGAFREAPVHLEVQYEMAPEYHNPMELYGTTAVWESGGRLTVYDKTQGSQNVQAWLCKVFGLRKKNVRVINHHVGGAFGSGLRPHAHAFCAVMAALALERPVRVSLTRQEMFTTGYRPDTQHTIGLACDHEGRLKAVTHDGIAATSRFEDYQENLVNWSGLLYHCDNVRLRYQLAKLDTCTPCDMRAPGAASGVNVLECAIDELAFAAGLDPLAFRRLNYTDRDENGGKTLTSKSLEACYHAASEAFGWHQRSFAPRSMREGSELIGWGMASGVWESMVMKTSARCTLTPDGRLTVAVATSDIGTGTRTILTQIAADALGLAMDRVTTELGDSSLPASPVEGGSWTAASAGTAVTKACAELRERLFGHARKMTNSPLSDADIDSVTFADGRIARADDPARSVTIAEAMQAAEVPRLEGKGTAWPDLLGMLKYATYSHSAVFAEVRVDEELGVVRVTRVVCAVGAGRILNPKTARSQILGGIVMGIGMALHEEAMTDHALGRIVNHNLAEYHVPAHADIAGDIEVVFVEEHDDKASPIGVKGLGEIGIVGTAAAVANAIFHATGARVREFPITLDKILKAMPVPRSDDQAHP